MQTEFEAKFYPITKEDFRNKLTTIGATLVTPERLMKRSLADDRNNPGLPFHYLRVRDEGDVVRLSAKTHARTGGNIEDQKELDFLVSDYDAAVTFLKLLGFNISHYQETKRETWSYDNAHIEIDTWPGLETFAEIEATSEEHVKKIADLLDLDWDTKWITSTVELYEHVYGFSREETHEKMSHLTFETNAFANKS